MRFATFRTLYCWWSLGDGVNWLGIIIRSNLVGYLTANLANILSPLTGKSDYTVNNSALFVSINSERLQENEITVSFDVKSPFTNVPIEGAVKTALPKLEGDPFLADRRTPTQIADLLDFF